MPVVARDDDIQIEKLTLGPFGTNAYIVTCLKTEESALIDTPAEASVILEKLKTTSPRYILLTHNHMDHLGALSEVHSSLGVTLAVHAADAGNLPSKQELYLTDGDILPVGALKIEVLHTPGHTPGSLCFKVGRYLVSGDTIFTSGPGKTSSPAAFTQIIKSITEKIFILPDDTPIFPGHGDDTVLKKEKEEYAAFSSRSHDPGLCGDIIWLSS